MGEKENRINLSYHHLSRAEKSLESAVVLEKNELFDDSISRAYYAAYHSMYAMLNSIGENPKTHKGVVNLLFIHFVENNKMKKSFHKLLNQLLNFRGDADYGVFPQFDQSDADNAIDTARRAIEQARQWLEQFKT